LRRAGLIAHDGNEQVRNAGRALVTEHGQLPAISAIEQQNLDGLHHYLVLDQDEGFAQFLRAAGARSVQHMPVSLDRAVNGFLAKNHAAPAMPAGTSA
jgi:hypothetical protein